MSAATKTKAVAILGLVGLSVLALHQAGGPGPVSAGTSSPENTDEASGHSTGKESNMALEKATFAAGCFWGVEAAFQNIEGVHDTTVGYTGGHVPNPTYKQVCSGNTGHAEALQVEYDPEKVSYEELLNVFWKNHDPTQVNRQGPDVGSQYRSVIFYHNEEQKELAEASKERLDESGKHRRPIATRIEKVMEFWPAEEYHQRYLEKRGLVQCHTG